MLKTFGKMHNDVEKLLVNIYKSIVRSRVSNKMIHKNKIRFHYILDIMKPVCYNSVKGIL